MLRASPLLRDRALFEQGRLDMVAPVVTDLPPDFAASAGQAAAHLPEGFTARLWAQLRVKELLRRATISPSAAAVNEANREATQLAIKYALVTPLTSLVVVEATADGTTPAPTDAVPTSLHLVPSMSPPPPCWPRAPSTTMSHYPLPLQSHPPCSPQRQHRRMTCQPLLLRLQHRPKPHCQPQ